MSLPRLLHVKLTPKAASERIGETRPGKNGVLELAVYVTAPPDKNKANEALIRLLAKHFDVAPSHVVIIRGHTSRHKVIEIQE